MPFTSIRTLFATGLGLGFSPVAPGTFGSLLGCLLYFLVSGFSTPAYLLFAVVFIFISIWSADGRAKELNAKDPGQIVVDEVAGVIVTMAFHSFSISGLVAGFLFFRFFDILKIWPANYVERRFSGGFGIVADDLVAAVYANACLFGCEFIARHYGFSMFGVN